jgi:hypothetical protein
VTDQNCICKEIDSRFSLGNASYHAVQNVLSSCLLSKNGQIRIHNIEILPGLYKFKSYLTLSEEHKLRMFGPKG